jgi:hypothetical protein
MKIFNMVLFGWPIFPKEVEVGQPGVSGDLSFLLPISLLYYRKAKLNIGEP